MHLLPGTPDDALLIPLYSLYSRCTHTVLIHYAGTPDDALLIPLYSLYSRCTHTVLIHYAGTPDDPTVEEMDMLLRKTNVSGGGSASPEVSALGLGEKVSCTIHYALYTMHYTHYCYGQGLEGAATRGRDEKVRGVIAAPRVE
jgi:hypothetical protein